MFRGRPLAERAEHEHDTAGRLVRSVTYREADWTLTDRAEALALTQLEQSLCPCGCGHPRAEAWDDDNDGWYEVEETVVCQARAAMDRWQTEHGGRPPTPGLLPYPRFTRHDEDEESG